MSLIWIVVLAEAYQLYPSLFLQFTFKDDVNLGYRIAKVCDRLIEESPNKHALRSRLCRELDCNLKAMVEPQHHVVPLLLERYNSAMLCGDVECGKSMPFEFCYYSFSVTHGPDETKAMLNLAAYITGSLYTGESLLPLSQRFKSFLEQSVSPSPGIKDTSFSWIRSTLHCVCS